jgi:Abnormal spindle-like microcephaly-assoc'd, ASPM-SPD-2-Hydin/Transmembrane protein 131-like N-terminal
MVGTHFCKCPQYKSLFRAFLVVLAFCFFAGQAAVARATARGAIAGRPIASESLMECTPGAVAFQDVSVGDTYTQNVRITNLSESTLQIKKIGTSNANFQVKGIFLPVVVAHGTSESFTVSFRPKKEGRADGQISIFTSASDAPSIVTVSASTIALQTELTASEAAIDFEDVAVGGMGKQEVSLTNSGTRDLMIPSMSVTGHDFSVSGGTATRLNPGQSVTVDVSFAPKSAGRRSGQLAISSADGGSLLLIPLTATGAESSRSAVKLSWEESPVTVAGYVVYRSADSSGPYRRISEAATPEYVDSGLAAGHTYFYVVTSLDSDEVESEFSSPISATVPEA